MTPKYEREYKCKAKIKRNINERRPVIVLKKMLDTRNSRSYVGYGTLGD